MVYLLKITIQIRLNYFIFVFIDLSSEILDILIKKILKHILSSKRSRCGHSSCSSSFIVFARIVNFSIRPALDVSTNLGHTSGKAKFVVDFDKPLLDSKTVWEIRETML